MQIDPPTPTTADTRRWSAAWLGLALAAWSLSSACAPAAAALLGSGGEDTPTEETGSPSSTDSDASNDSDDGSDSNGNDPSGDTGTDPGDDPGDDPGQDPGDDGDDDVVVDPDPIDFFEEEPNDFFDEANDLGDVGPGSTINVFGTIDSFFDDDIFTANVVEESDFAFLLTPLTAADLDAFTLDSDGLIAGIFDDIEISEFGSGTASPGKNGIHVFTVDAAPVDYLLTISFFEPGSAP